jgi:hypothetical protein
VDHVFGAGFADADDGDLLAKYATASEGMSFVHILCHPVRSTDRRASAVGSSLAGRSRENVS